MMTSQFKKLNLIIGWVVWAIATFTYVSTIEPTASFWDCGEYIACAYKLEVGHPPGAPFFLLLGRFFALFAGNDPTKAAMMVNVMSALASSFTILFLFWSITRLGIRIYGRTTENMPMSRQIAILMAGAVGALAYTFSDSFWFSAVEGEVYALSSFFTAVVFWAILKWDEEDEVSPTSAMRWIVLIAYLVGLSIGVHLLNLLVIPAIGFVVYFKKYKFTWKGFFIAGIASVLILGLIQNLIIPKLVKFLADYEVFFTNRFHLPYSSGAVVFFILLVVSLVYFILYTSSKKENHFKIAFYTAIAFSGFAVIVAPGGGGMFMRLIFLGGALYAINKYKSKIITLNTIFLSLATLLIGYSSFFVLVIRSQANTPMDENDPENAPNMLSYLLREQYGDWPVLYGPYYNAPQLPQSQFGDGDPIYAKDKKKGDYKVVDDRKHSKPKYEKEFCTVFPRMWSSQSHHESGYRYWGNVAENHRNKVMESANGETYNEEIPTMKANLTYFSNYQVGYMYLRYFMWNFAGRQNDVQGVTGNNMEGNWITGISSLDNSRLDYDTTNPIYRDKNNFATNRYFMIPLILGLLGLFFHYQRNKADMWVVLCFFFLTGLAIVIYLNQSPYQPRERDYAYTGSFYAFAVWIGFGVLWLYETLSKNAASMVMAIGSGVLGLAAPAIMAKEGWNDHDRSLRTLGRDCAIDYLYSCAKNAIIFTNGDNDTFPLWYAQEVEGIRTDVRVVNLSLLNTDWYIRQMRRAAYESEPVPFTIPEEKVEAEKLSYMLVDSRSTQPMELSAAMTAALDENPAGKYDAGGQLIDVLPSKSLYLNVDSMAVVKNQVIEPAMYPRMDKRMNWELGGRRYITKADIMVLDLIAHNNWKRPIYFAVTTGDEAYIGLKKYFQLEGLAYRLTPVRQTEEEEGMGGRVATDIMYNNVMNHFAWGGMDQPGVNLDENCTRMTGNLRMQMSILANALIIEGKKDKAMKVLDLCLEKMPDENIPYDASIFQVCRSYYDLGAIDKANKLAKKLFDMYEGDVRIYMAQKPEHRRSYERELNQSKEIMKMLTSMAQQYKQEELYKDFLKRLSNGILTDEDMAPRQDQGQPLLK